MPMDSDPLQWRVSTRGQRQAMRITAALYAALGTVCLAEGLTIAALLLYAVPAGVTWFLSWDAERTAIVRTARAQAAAMAAVEAEAERMRNEEADRRALGAPPADIAAWRERKRRGEV